MGRLEASEGQHVIRISELETVVVLDSEGWSSLTHQYAMMTIMIIKVVIDTGFGLPYHDLNIKYFFCVANVTQNATQKKHPKCYTPIGNENTAEDP